MIMWEEEYKKFEAMKPGPDKVCYAIKMLTIIKLEEKLEEKRLTNNINN